MTRKTAVLAVVALVVAGTSAALAVGGATTHETGDAPMAQETTTTAAGMETTTAEGTVGVESAGVTFLNQTAGFTFTGDQPNTTTVLIERVVVPEGGFVAVHVGKNTTGEYATDARVDVGQVIGNSTYLEPGVHSNVVVELNESVNQSQTLVAMPHRDTNGNQQYDFPEADQPYTQDGSPVIDTAYVIVDYDVIEGIDVGSAAGAEGTTTAANETTTTET